MKNIVLALVGLLQIGGGSLGGAPLIPAQTFTISSPVSNGGPVGTPTCSANCTGLAWSITAGNSAGDFSINSSTGAITTTASGVSDITGSLFTASLTVQATNGASGSNTITVNAYADGSINGPGGTAQNATLLNSERARAPWKVAGVDYAAATVSQITSHCGSLTDWQAISQTGVSVNLGNHTVTISGNNVTLTCVDFSLHNGSIISVSGSNDILSWSYMVYGTGDESNFYILSGSGPNLTVEYCVMDGNGPTLGSSAANQSSLINYTSGITLLYNYFLNFNQHVLEQDASSSVSVIERYNYIYNGGSGATGQHLNYLQLGTNSATVTVTVEFNTTYQPTTPTSGGEGFQFGSFGTSAPTAITVDRNTLVYGPNGEGLMHVNETAQFPSNGGTSGNIFANYMDKHGGTSFFYHDPHACTGGVGSDVYGAACSSGNPSNIDMATGDVITTTP